MHVVLYSKMDFCNMYYSRRRLYRRENTDYVLYEDWHRWLQYSLTLAGSLQEGRPQPNPARYWSLSCRIMGSR